MPAGVATSSPGPLDGLLVADFSRVLAGPYAAMTLGDLGADVIKVERPGTGDDTRVWGPPWVDGVATYYTALNRNKRGITLDFSDPVDVSLAVELATRADILIENFRPGTLDRFGLGYDLLVQAMSGLMSITGQPDGEPTKVGVAVVDHICALQSTIGILAAVTARNTSGRGQRVEVSLMASALAALTNQASAHVGTGVVPTRMGNRHPSVVPYQTFRAGDGWFVVACGNDAQFARITIAIGRPELGSDERFRTNAARITNIDELDRVLTAAFATDTREYWINELSASGVPAGPINDIGQAFVTAADLGIDPVVTTEIDGVTQRTVRSPIGLSGTPLSVRRNAPTLGEHDAEIRAWLAGSG